MGGDGREAASRVSLPGRASGDIWGQGQSSGSMVPNRPCPREPPHSRLPTVFRVSPPFFGGLVCTTSSGSWLSMVLRGSMVTPQVLPADGRQSVPGWWSHGPGCGFQRSGGLRQLHPLPTSPGPQHPRGRVGNVSLLVSSKAQCGLLTSAPASPWVGLGQYVWGETWGISACQSLAGDLKI